jgi:SAM-dependent methyltransferase
MARAAQDREVCPMSTLHRLQSERVFHDLQAAQRARVLVHPAALQFADDDWLDHESWIRPAIDRLGDVRGCRALDLGCGHGMASIVLARRGAHVTALDLSPGYLAEAGRRAGANGIDLDLVQATGEALPFAPASFDRIWGNAVLHHLDLRRAAGELERVLAPGGVAVFCEPWGENPLLEWARRRLPYPHKERTVDERPLRRHQLRLLQAFFADLHWEGFQLLTMARRLLPPRWLLAGLEWCDRRLLHGVPALRRYCRYVVLTLRKPRLVH